MGKFKTAAMKKKTVWPPFPKEEVVEALKDRCLSLEAAQARMATELQKGNRWMAMVMCQFPDGDVATMTDWYVTQEESRAGRRAMAAVFEGGTLLSDAERADGKRYVAVAEPGCTPMRYLASWNFGIADGSKWMETVPEA